MKGTSASIARITLFSSLVLAGAIEPAVALDPTRPSSASRPPLAEQKAEEANVRYRVPIEGSPAAGPEDAPVTIVECMDLECPFCRRTVPVMEKIAEVYAGRVRFVFKHNPLSAHRNAVPAAMVAEEARKEGGDARFWEAARKILSAATLDRASLDKVAAELGLSPEAVHSAVQRTSYIERVRKDQILLHGLEARGTPTFFVNGKKMVGAAPFEAFQSVIDGELQVVAALVRSGVRPADVYAQLTGKGLASPQAKAPSGPTAIASSPVTAARIPLRPDDPSKGTAPAKVTLVVFADFQCPYCSRFELTLRAAEKRYSDQLRTVWKHEPLTFHPRALAAARVAEAARLQGKFWEMHDKIFAHQTDLSDRAFDSYAADLGLDMSRFHRDLGAEAVANRVAEDQQLATIVQATGTPTWFVNCRKVVGDRPFDVVEAVIDEEIKKADAMVKGGTPLDGSLYDRLCAANGADPKAAARPAAPARVVVPVRADDPIRGNAEAAITIVEFSDFQCPYCSAAASILRDIEHSYKDVRVVWKHMPLPFHSNAMPAALASEAAREQGKFWEMHDKIFSVQQGLSEEAYLRFAEDLGLDVARFRTVMRSPAVRARIEEDASAARAIGVNGTPTFVVNGEMVVGSTALRDAVGRHLVSLANR